MIIPWLRFEWKLDESGSELPAHPPFVARYAARDEEAAVQKVVLSAYSMDSTWGNTTRQLENYLRTSVERSFSKDSPACIVLQHGTRVIAASAFMTEADADNHLLTGPCVLHEYRSRGLGSVLLQITLFALREAGLSGAYGLTRDHTAASRFLYPKFGGRPEVWEAPVQADSRLTV